MKYVLVAVADSSYRGREALTYSCTRALETGSIVSVPLRSKDTLGVVIRSTVKPSFPVKSVSEVHELPSLPTPLVELLTWIVDYYASTIGISTQLFLPKRFSQPEKTDKATKVEHQLPPLNDEQQQVIDSIKGTGTYLLQGRTGSGKTRVYIELAKKSIATGKSVVILTPEIGLTSQLAHNFQEIFGNTVIVLHSQLPQSVRQKAWMHLLTSTDPVIVIGPRSALFSPLKQIGLIVIDEAHDPAYKQDQAPYHHASRAAAQLASLHKASLVLASATPLITDYFMATQKRRPILRMEQLAKGNENYTHNVIVVDQRNRSLFTKNPNLSNALIEKMQQKIDKQEQVLLFLNRRGTARTILCNNCGWQALCHNCDLPVVYHGDIHKIRCHSCSYLDNLPQKCPECHDTNIFFKGIGTKALVVQVERLFPEARIMRFDNDNLRKERLEQHFDILQSGHIDILIGTQTLSKGLDLPHLGLVGVIAADTSLYLPDFSAEETTYQLLTQVLGRVGRGHRATEAIIQTYNPSGTLIRSVTDQDWDSFYNKEITEREAFLFPPFCHLLRLTCRRAKRDTAEQAARKLFQDLQNSNLHVSLSGPTPALHEKVNNKYQWQIVVKAKERRQLLHIIRYLPSGWSFDIDVMNLL